MLLELYPRVHRRYASLPIIGPALDGYVAWLLTRGYSTDRAREHFRAAPRLVGQLQQHGVRTLAGITRARLRGCAPTDSQDDPDLAALVRQLDRYFEAELSLYPAPTFTCIEQRVTTYTTYLERVRGFARSTCTYHGQTVTAFLTHLGYEKAPTRLAAVTSRDLEAFLCAVGPRQTRASLQHVVSHLRAFLRFLASAGEIPPGLDVQIDTPRVYRGEQLPRALPWDTVQAFLKAIDRTTPMGRRDYAMFLLIGTYGLRACEIVTLTLDDVEWRARRFRVPQRKTRGALWLPLTDEVGSALLDYLRHGRPALAVRRQRVPFRGAPPPTYRELFLRHRTPVGVLKPTAVAEAFQAWSTRSGLAIPFQGPHCLRHSYAVYLLRSGISLKMIGDLLGHRTLESTCVYLRLAVEDLREVALDLPAEVSRGATEVAS
ncbi:MAG: tyrosine-type recombinase/integrase [Acidobacteria bacterium]|nr:tyrosine-type recombinase/integrase [Acidobacteriota bacterium]